MSVTDTLAIIGVAGSSFAIGWNIFRDISNRDRLRVTCRRGSIVPQFGPPDPKEHIIWHITNAGPRPIMLTGVGGVFKKEWRRRGKQQNRYFFINDLLLPKMLEPGEYHITTTDEQVFVGPKLQSLIAWDSLQREYRAPRRHVQELVSPQEGRGIRYESADRDDVEGGAE